MGVSNVIFLETYEVTNGVLKATEARELPMTHIQKLVIGKKRSIDTKTLRLYIVEVATKHITNVTELFAWQDGTPFSQTHSTHLRQVQARDQALLHDNLFKWHRDLHITFDLNRLWSMIKHPYHVVREAHFLWQVAYRIPATQH